MFQSGEQVLSLPGGGLENHSEKRLRTLLQMVRVSGLRLVQAGSLRYRLREEWGACPGGQCARSPRDAGD